MLNNLSKHGALSISQPSKHDFKNSDVQLSLNKKLLFQGISRSKQRKHTMLLLPVLKYILVLSPYLIVIIDYFNLFYPRRGFLELTALIHTNFKR